MKCTRGVVSKYGDKDNTGESGEVDKGLTL